MQASLVIPFEICHKQKNLRLLELPPALLKLATSTHPSSLLLKSILLEDNKLSTSTHNQAVLCTDDKTFHIRQVHSSNSIYITEPAREDDAPEGKPLHRAGIRAIAQCAATLELIPTSVDGASMLRQTLPIYKGPLDTLKSKLDSVASSYPKTRTSKHKLSEDLPISPQEFEDSCIELCVFEVFGQAWVPSALELSAIWKSIISAATIKGVNLAEAFEAKDLIDTVIEEDKFPQDLFNAVMKRTCIDDESSGVKRVTPDQQRCVTWVGGVLLEELSSCKGGVTDSKFLHEWQNLLPEGWRKSAAFNALKCEYHRPSNNRISFGTDEVHLLSSSKVSDATEKSRRKWHEKFKNTRR